MAWPVVGMLLGPLICLALAVLETLGTWAFTGQAELVTLWWFLFPYAILLGLFASTLIGMPVSVLLLRSGWSGRLPFALAGVLAGAGVFSIFVQPDNTSDLLITVVLLGVMVAHGIGYALAFQWMVRHSGLPSNGVTDESDEDASNRFAR